MNGPTLVVRFDLDQTGPGSRAPHVADQVLQGAHAGHGRVLDYAWSHEAKNWKGGWPKPELGSGEKQILAAVRSFVAAGADIPPDIALTLFGYLERIYDPEESES